ncbi:MAG TPA: Ldh family oxidoreductase [Pirellulales bacterium]|nr:Ldh family oxidoreductase [Pirellulales bacterium]
MPTVQATVLESLIARIFQACGVAGEEARIVADHLVDAEACGHVSHGLLRVASYVDAVTEGRIAAGAKLQVISESPAAAVLDGQHGFGQVMAMQAMGFAVALAERAGIGAVTLVNCSHTGRLGCYTEWAARRGVAALMMVNSGGCGQWVAPYGGIAGRLATSPLSFAVPTDGEDPLMLDMATSVAPEGKVRAAQVAGKRLPEGWIIDHRGQPSTDPADLYGPPRGALLPLGGHKGSGLAMVIDALAGGLSGAGCCTEVTAPMGGKTDGVFIIAIKIAAFQLLSTYQTQIGQLVRHVKSSPAASGFSEVLVAGEIEAKTRQARRRDGIPVEPATWDVLQSLSERFHLAL